MSPWFGLLAPARTPDDMSARITAATLAALERPDVRAALAAIGGLVTPMGAEHSSASSPRRTNAGVASFEAGLVPIGTGPIGNIGTPQ